MRQYNLTQLREELYRIDSLTDREREILYQELKKYSGGGGISFSEFQKVIWKLRDEYKISKIDEKYLKKLLDYLK